jgi:dTDP-4-dehydrorhamnose reductase
MHSSIHITGAGGQLGRELAERLQKTDYSFYLHSHHDWDITQHEQTKRILADQPSIIINCAAYTAVDKAEDNELAAFTLNAEGPAGLARAARETGSFLIQISTDFVYGWKDSHRSHAPDWDTAARGVYARSKEAGDLAIRQICEQNGKLKQAAVIRTSWLYSRYGSNFPSTILRLASTREKLTVIEDQIGRPTWAGRLADFILFYIQHKDLFNQPSEKHGELIHFSNEGVASWFDFAHAVVEMGAQMGLLVRTIPILPIATHQYPLPAPRPHFSVMDLEQTRSLFSIPHWKDDLIVFLKQLKDANP